MSAYVSGGAAFHGSIPTLAIQLRQSNTFAAQWCHAADTPLQVATTTPTNNLMLGIPLPAHVSGTFDTQAIARVTALQNNPNPGWDDPGANYTPASTELALDLLGIG